MHIRTNDQVQVMSGDDRGKRGQVLSVDRTAGKVVVKGINLVYKHLRRSQQSPQGGRLSKEMPIDISSVMLLCPQTNQPTRVGVRYLDDGTKELYSKKSGATIRRLSPPRKAYARKQA